MDAVMSAGANRIGGIEYQSSELRKYKDEARDAAAKAAREKADALAKALGNQIGKTYSIEEVQQRENYYSVLANTTLEDTRSRAPSTAPGQLTVTASVVVSFDLLGPGVLADVQRPTTASQTKRRPLRVAFDEL